MRSVNRNNNFYTAFFILLLAGFAIRLFLSQYLTYGPDLKTFKVWADTVASTGFGNFYNKVWCDYMPGYIYVLWLLNKISVLLPSIPKDIIFKIPANTADLAITLLLFLYLRRLKDVKTAIAGSLLYLFNPAIMGNSTFWGQIDSFHALAILLSVLFVIKRNYFFSGLFTAAAFMIKPQSLVIFPLVGIFVIIPFFGKEHKTHGSRFRSLSSVLWFFSGCVFIAFIVTLPFVIKGVSSIPELVYRQIIFIHERFSSSYDQYQYASINAFNFWGMFAMWKSDSKIFAGITYRYWGIFIFALVYAYVSASMFWLAIKRRTETILINNTVFIKGFTIIFMALFLFLTRVHERHLLTAIVLFSFIALVSGKYLIMYGMISIIYVFNLFYSYVYAYPSFNFLPGHIFTPLMFLSSLSLIFFFIILLIDYSAEIIPSFYSGDFFLDVIDRTSEKGVKKISLFVILGLLISISAGLKFHDLYKPDNYYFDEVYFAFTSEQMAKSDIKAWESGHSAPGNFAYEWTHPPLGKEIIAAGIRLFGDNTFGWRFFGALFGALGTILIYLLTKELFESSSAGIFASFLYTFDSLIFVLSRITMVDIFIVNFILLSCIFFIRYIKYRIGFYLVLAGLFSGAAMSVKWNGVLAPALLFVLTLAFLFRDIYSPGYTQKQREGFTGTLFLILISFIFVPLLVYLITYLPLLKHGHKLSYILDLQMAMYNYHKGVVSTHSYQSPWWSWVLMLRPVFLYLKDLGQRSEYIYAMGNPVIWWSGLVFIPAAVFYTVKERLFPLGFAIVCFFSFWLPWSLSPRKVIFIYHFIPSLVFLFIINGYILDHLWKRSTDGRIVVLFYLFLVFAAFVYFYPILSGQPVPTSDISNYMWLKSWR